MAPLIFEQIRFFDPKLNPYYEHSEVQLFLALDGKNIVGRISAQTNRNHNKVHQDKVGFFGFFETIDDQAVANALLATAEKWLFEKGFDTMRGPASLSVNDECGLLIDGFDSSPMVLMSYNQPHYIRLLENSGFYKAMDLYAYATQVSPPPARLKRLADRLEKRDRFTIRALNSRNKRKLRGDIEKIFQLYETAWEKNWGYVPMTDKEFDQLVNKLLPIIIPELIFIAEIDGNAVGISVTLPDYNYVLHKMRGKIFPLGWLKFLYHRNKIPNLRVTIMGVLPEYKNRGIDAVMYCKSFEAAKKQKNNFQIAEFSWILETNSMMNKIANPLNAKIYKTYRLYDRKIK